MKIYQLVEKLKQDVLPHTHTHTQLDDLIHVRYYFQSLKYHVVWWSVILLGMRDAIGLIFDRGFS